MQGVSKFFRQSKLWSKVIQRNASTKDAATTNWFRSEAGAMAMKSIIQTVPVDFLKSSNIQEYVDCALCSDRSSFVPYPHRHIIHQLLTYPLTLSYGLRNLFPTEDHFNHFEELRVTVLGARAESSLPMQWWRHVLFLNPTVKRLSIRFIGPGLGVANNQRDISSQWKWTTGCGNSSQLNLFVDPSHDSCVLHEHHDAHQLLLQSHIFVLYNPGLGSSFLKSAWRPTVEMLLSSKKPILCTALSNSDLNNDVTALQDIAARRSDDQDIGESFEMLLEPQKNPFLSTLVRQDEANQPIQTNQFVYIFRSK